MIATFLEQQAQHQQRSYALNLYQTKVKEQLYPVVLNVVSQVTNTL